MIPAISPSGAASDRHSRDSAGVAMIELALMLPFLILLFFGATEFVRVLQTKQNLSAIVREGATSVFRECLELDNPDPCLDSVYSRIQAAADAIQPGSSIKLSLYVMAEAPATTISVFTRGPLASLYNAADFASGGSLNDVISDERRLAIAEASFTLDLIIPVFSNPEFYDAAIF